MEVRRELTVESNVNMDEETKKMYDLGNSTFFEKQDSQNSTLKT